MNPFKKKIDVKAQVRESKRGVNKGVRELERELLSLKQEENKLVQQIKLAAKQGNQSATRILAKSLVRLRQQQVKLTQSVAQLKGVNTTLTTAAATHTVGGAMKTASGAIQAVGAATDPQKIQQSMMDFAKQNEKMEMAQEMMDDAIDSAMDTEETEGEADEVMNQVLDEIGVDISSQMAGVSAPRTRVGTSQQAQEEDAEAAALQQRLAALK